MRRWIAEAAATGRLPAGYRLPPVRALATRLHLAANTVARAYRELEEAGIVVTAGRAGTTVAAPDAAAARVSDAAGALVRAAYAAGLDRDAVTAMLDAAWTAVGAGGERGGTPGGSPSGPPAGPLGGTRGTGPGSAVG